MDRKTLESLLPFVQKYLPSSLSSPLEQLRSLPATVSDNPSQLVPLLISLVTLYATVMSFYHTSRYAFRTLWFMLKWGVLLGVVVAGYAGWNGWDVGAGGAGVGRTALAAGRQGLQWWNTGGFGNGVSATSVGNNGAASGRRRAAAANGKRSANGRPRTWATATDDGGWDDPDEVDIGADDTIGAIQETLLRFFGSGEDASPNGAGGRKKSTAKGRKTMGKKETAKANEGGYDLTSMAIKYAMGGAQKLWASTSQKVEEDKRSKKGWF